MPVDPAAASVWQEAQVLENTFMPAFRLTAVAELELPEERAWWTRRSSLELTPVAPIW